MKKKEDRRGFFFFNCVCTKQGKGHKRKPENISIDMGKAQQQHKKKKENKVCLHKKYENLTSLVKVRDGISLQTSRISTLMVAEFRKASTESTFAYVQFCHDDMDV